ncbi:pheromone-binding protein-related protein 6 isoform X2 [Nasonia vitripennis]|uniref:Putative odorant binding protein 1 n=1 Tax=Nasonia vitripennis TaxID=7425 RepID=G8B1K6_NASVI|nr:pheromone-binding protein-related protein 6 isoform X2 [Nasonia vitripennis]CCD17770.1 putative odorant binding protein 1 [Nasonia vitripennis]
MMKNLTLCFLVVVLGVIKVNGNEIPHEIRHMVVGVRDKCHRETGVDIEHVDRTVEGYFHPSELLGCYFSCIFNHFDLLDKDGHLDWDKLVPRIPESFKEHADEMIAACRSTTGKDPCDSALNIVQCFQKTNPSKYFVI